MTATLKITNLQNESSVTPNIVLNADGTTTIAGTIATALTTSGNLNFTGTNNRITGDFSNATAANRVAFQSSTTNGATVVNIAPNGTSTNASIIAFSDSAIANSSFLQMRCDSTAEARFTSGAIGSGTSLPMTFYTGGSERLRLDTSGNLGLGVTPSAWASGNFLGLQIGKGGSIAGRTAADGEDQVYVSANAYFDGASWKYIGSYHASNYYQDNGTHVWRTAPSGTAGNAISFTQAMTLDASGNLGIGTASPAFGTGSGLEIERAGVATLRLENSSAGNNFELYSDSLANGINLRGYNAAPMLFWTNNTERARIDSSGNLLVGTTSNFSSQAKLAARWAGSGAWGIGLQPTGQDNANSIVFLSTGGASVGVISQTSVSTTYATSSDYRLKENVAPMTGALATVAQLKPCTYTWKADGSAGQGFIAHELQAVVPDCVTGEKDAVDSDGKPQYQGVDTSFLVATLTAAIQEQQAIITQLQADVAALKGAA